MAETVEGGIYKVGDEWQDANGNKVDAPKANDRDAPDNAAQVPSTTDETYPHKELLAAGGIADSNAARNANYEELIAIDGIGPAKAREIMDHFGNGN